MSFVCLSGILVDFAGYGSIRVLWPSLRVWHRQCRGLRKSPGPHGVHVDQSDVTLKETPCAPSVVRSVLTFLQVWPLAPVRLRLLPHAAFFCRFALPGV